MLCRSLRCRLIQPVAILFLSMCSLLSGFYPSKIAIFIALPIWCKKKLLFQFLLLFVLCFFAAQGKNVSLLKHCCCSFSRAASLYLLQTIKLLNLKKLLRVKHLVTQKLQKIFTDICVKVVYVEYIAGFVCSGLEVYHNSYNLGKDIYSQRPSQLLFLSFLFRSVSTNKSITVKLSWTL